jgi:hypothetical protein
MARTGTALAAAPTRDAAEHRIGAHYRNDDRDQSHVAAFSDVSWVTTRVAALARGASSHSTENRSGAPALPEVLGLSSARRDRGGTPFSALGD